MDDASFSEKMTKSEWLQKGMTTSWSLASPTDWNSKLETLNNKWMDKKREKQKKSPRFTLLCERSFLWLSLALLTQWQIRAPAQWRASVICATIRETEWGKDRWGRARARGAELLLWKEIWACVERGRWYAQCRNVWGEMCVTVSECVRDEEGVETGRIWREGNGGWGKIEKKNTDRREESIRSRKGG